MCALQGAKALTGLTYSINSGNRQAKNDKHYVTTMTTRTDTHQTRTCGTIRSLPTLNHSRFITSPNLDRHVTSYNCRANIQFGLQNHGSSRCTLLGVISSSDLGVAQLVHKWFSTCKTQWQVRAPYHVVLMFDEPLKRSPVSIAVKALDSLPFVPYSRPSSGAVDIHYWWFLTGM